jgi:leucyl aminopeptidase
MSENYTPEVPGLAVKSGNPLTAITDVVIIATSSDAKFSIVSPAMTAAGKAKVRRSLLAVGATGKADEVVRIAGHGLSGASVIVAVGLGSVKDPLTAEQLRRAAGNATRSLMGFKKVVIDFPAVTGEQISAVLEGAALGAYSFSDHKHSTLNKSKSGVSSITVLCSDAKAKEIKTAVHRARTITQAIVFARDAINTSPLHLPPATLALRATQLLADTSVSVSILDEKDLLAGGYGGILAVGQGSARPPRLIRMSYQPEGATQHIALVGKGITFDTGGISLKPPASMHEMKADMSGAAAVIATMRAVADLELPIAVTAYAACAENMPGGSAQRPGDVISAYGGRTIEVLNTDAEGRLVLADALVRAAEDNPDAVIDIATLTGHAVIALGFRTAGVLGDESMRDIVISSAKTAGEEFWPMPMPTELRGTLESLVADIANIGIREGGMLAAGLFLKEFIAKDLPWAHLDIAGPAYNSQAAHGYTHKGGVGFGVRTLVSVLEDFISGVAKV